MAHLPKGQGVFLPPFKAWLASNIPAVYDNTMTYYEELCALIKYLQDVVIPALNHNAEAVTTIATAVEQLQKYVEDYFKNLDVQEEIDNKLDQMAADGTLQEIIGEYLNMGAIWGYDTVADMKAGTNLVDGSTAQTKGYYSVNDGGDALYHITETAPSGYYETLNNGLYAELITDKINVKQVGLKGDGATDDWTAFKSMLDAYNVTKIHIFFPKGTYRFEKHNERFTLPASTILEGDNAEIFFNDTEDSGVSLMEGANTEFTLKGLKIKSTYDTITSQTNTALFYYDNSDNASTVTIENCKFESFRTSIFMMKNCKRLNVKNSEYYNIGGDSNRFLNCAYSCVTDCKFELCGDDVVSTHGDIENSTHIFANNKVIKSLGPAYLGGKNIDIHDNAFINPIMLFKSGIDRTEGAETDVVNFHDNYVLQPIRRNNGDGVITWIGAGTKKILFNHNTLRDGNLSYVARLNIAGTVYTDVEVVKGTYIVCTHDSSYTHEYLQFNDNYCDVKNGPSELGLGGTRLMNGKFAKLDMYRNRIENFYSSFIGQANIKLSWNVCDNYFNGDREHLLTTDGMWTNSSSLRVFNTYPNNFANNTLRNVSGNYGLPKTNKILYQTDGKYMNPISNASPSEFIPYDESTGELLNVIQEKGTMPTTGYYHAGTYVMTNYTSNGPIGWYRATTGNGHVLNTDWIPLYVSNAPIA